MPASSWKNFFKNNPHFLHEYIGMRESGKRLFTKHKLILPNSPLLPVCAIEGNGMCAQPDPHEFGVSNIWSFGMALSTQEHEITRTLISAKSAWNDVTSLEQTLMCTTPTQFFCFRPINRQSALALVGAPVINNFTMSCVHDAERSR